MGPHVVIELIQRLERRQQSLFRIHVSHPALYARARRFFGSWAAAVRAAGLDYPLAVRRARQQSLLTRRRRRLTRVRERRSASAPTTDARQRLAPPGGAREEGHSSGPT